MRILKILALGVAVFLAGNAFAGDMKLILESLGPDGTRSPKEIVAIPDCDFVKLVKALEPFEAVKQEGRDNITWYDVKSKTLEENRKNGYVKIEIYGCSLDYAEQIISRGSGNSHTFYKFHFDIPWETKIPLYDKEGKIASTMWPAVEIFSNNLSPQEPFADQFLTWKPVNLYGWINVHRRSYEFPYTADKISGVVITIQPEYINGVRVSMPPPPPPNP